MAGGNGGARPADGGASAAATADANAPAQTRVPLQGDAPARRLFITSVRCRRAGPTRCQKGHAAHPGEAVRRVQPDQDRRRDHRLRGHRTKSPSSARRNPPPRTPRPVAQAAARAGQRPGSYRSASPTHRAGPTPADAQATPIRVKIPAEPSRDTALPECPTPARSPRATPRVRFIGILMLLRTES